MRSFAANSERGLFVEGLVFFVFFVVVFAVVAVFTVSKQNDWRDDLVNNWNVQRPGNEFPAYWNIAGRWEEKLPAEVVPDLEAWRLSSQTFSLVGARFDICTFISRVEETGSGLAISADAARRTSSCAAATNLVTNPIVRRKLESAYVFNPDVPEVLFLVNAAFDRSTGEISAAYIAETSARDHTYIPYVGCLGGACGTAGPSPSPSPTPSDSAVPTPSLAVTIDPSIPPTVSPTPTPTPTPTVTVSPSPIGTPSLLATVDVTFVPPGSSTPTNSPTPPATTSLVPTIAPGVSVTPTGTLPPLPSKTPGASVVPTNLLPGP